MEKEAASSLYKNFKSLRYPSLNSLRKDVNGHGEWKMIHGIPVMDII